MYDITISADTPGELVANIKALAALMSGGAFADTVPAETAPDATIAAGKVKAVPAKPKAEAPKEPEPEPARAPLLDFNTEVAPTVIRIVESHGKPLVASVLEQFGVAKASEMQPELWPELLVALEAAAEAL